MAATASMLRKDKSWINNTPDRRAVGVMPGTQQRVAAAGHDQPAGASAAGGAAAEERNALPSRAPADRRETGRKDSAKRRRPTPRQGADAPADRRQVRQQAGQRRRSAGKGAAMLTSRVAGRRPHRRFHGAHAPGRDKRCTTRPITTWRGTLRVAERRDATAATARSRTRGNSCTTPPNWPAGDRGVLGGAVWWAAWRWRPKGRRPTGPVRKLPGTTAAEFDGTNPRFGGGFGGRTGDAYPPSSTTHRGITAAAARRRGTERGGGAALATFSTTRRPRLPAAGCAGGGLETTGCDTETALDRGGGTTAARMAGPAKGTTTAGLDQKRTPHLQQSRRPLT